MRIGLRKIAAQILSAKYLRNILAHNISATYCGKILVQDIKVAQPIAFGGFWQTLQIKFSQDPQDEILARNISAPCAPEANA